MRGEDKSDDEEQEQGVDTMDTQIVADVYDSQSSASGCSSNITTPLPLTPCTRPAPGKRMHYKRDAVEEKLLQIIGKPEEGPDEDKIFCLYLATSVRKIKDPQRKEYTKLQLHLQHTMYNCMYGSSQPNVGLTQQVPMSMSHPQQSYNYGVNTDDSSFSCITLLVLLMVKFYVFECLCL